MIFVGSKVFTHRDIGKIKHMYAWLFLWGGGHLGGTENLGGGGARAPQPLRSYVPANKAFGISKQALEFVRDVIMLRHGRTFWEKCLFCNTST